MPHYNHTNDDDSLTDAGRKRRLLILASDLAPSPSVGRLRVQKLCKYLPRFGWQVRAIAFDAGRSADPALLQELPDDLIVRRVHVPRMIDSVIDAGKCLLGRGGRSAAAPSTTAPLAGPGIGSVGGMASLAAPLQWLKRLAARRLLIPDDNVLGIASMAAETIRQVHAWKPDAMLVSVPGFSPLVAAAIAQQRTGVPMVVDYRDLWHGDVLRQWVGQWREALELRLELWCLQHCCGILAVSENYLVQAQILAATAGRKLFVRAVTNGFDEDDFPPSAPPPDRAGRPMEILHAGRLFKTRTADALLQALGAMRQRGAIAAGDLHITFLGEVEAAQMRRLEKIRGQFGLEEMVTFRPYVTRRQCLAMEAAADCLLVIGNEGPHSEGTMSMKLFEYAGAGRPVLALLNEGEGRQFVLASGIGRTAPISETEKINEALGGLLADWRNGRPLAQPCAQFLRAYRFEALAGRVSEFLVEAIRPRKRGR